LIRDGLLIPDPNLDFFLPIPDPGGLKGTGSRIRIPNTALFNTSAVYLQAYPCPHQGNNAVLRIRDVYPGSRILIFNHPGSRIPDPKTATKERGGKKFVVIPFYVATNFTKLKIILVLEC
jgi:hypothetical protein